MRRLFSMMVIAAAIVVLPAIAMADGDKDNAKKDRKGHKRPSAKAMFARFDTNNDQKLSVEEFTAGTKKMHARIAAHMKKAAARCGGHPQRGAHPRHGAHMRRGGSEVAKKIRAKMAERFKAADKNKDGKLSKKEAPERLKSHFEKIDADKDGQLTREELKKAFQARRKAMGKGHNHGPKGKRGKGKAAPPQPPKA